MICASPFSSIFLKRNFSTSSCDVITQQVRYGLVATYSRFKFFSQLLETDSLLFSFVYMCFRVACVKGFR